MARTRASSNCFAVKTSGHLDTTPITGAVSLRRIKIPDVLQKRWRKTCWKSAANLNVPIRFDRKKKLNHMELKPNMIQSSLQCNRPLSHIGPWEESVARFSVCQKVQLAQFGWKWQDQSASQSWRSYAQLCSAMLSWSGPSMPLWVNSLSGARCLWISRCCLVGSQEWDSGMGCKFSGPKFAFVPVFPRPRTKKEPWRMTVKRAVPIFSAFTSAQGQQPMWTVTYTSTLHWNLFNTWMFKGTK